MSSSQKSPSLSDIQQTSAVASSSNPDTPENVDKHWEDFFTEVAPPEEYEDTLKKIRKFVADAVSDSLRVVVVSSGGTTVPLEQLTVRFVDNFSLGTRGAASTECFLTKDYRVIFLHRTKSLLPFARHIPPSLDLLELHGCQNNCIKVKDSEKETVREVLEKYLIYKESCLMVKYTTLGDYLWLLKGISIEVNSMRSSAMLYLAAAVSDFYVPKAEMPEHKIQSDAAPGITFSLVPKMLRPLTNKWAPQAFIISFKLETDQELLFKKAMHALETYNHNMVIANLLTTRKRVVTIVERNGTVTEIRNPSEEIEIEKLIVDHIVGKHSEYIEQCYNAKIKKNWADHMSTVTEVD